MKNGSQKKIENQNRLISKEENEKVAPLLNKNNNMSK